MAIPGINASRYYYPQNFAEDIQTQESIFLGTFAQQPTAADYPLKAIREVVTRINFESQQHLYALGDV